MPREFLRRLIFSLAIAAVVAAAYRFVVHRDGQDVTALNRYVQRKRLGIRRQPVARQEPERQGVPGGGPDGLFLSGTSRALAAAQVDEAARPPEPAAKAEAESVAHRATVGAFSVASPPATRAEQLRGPDVSDSEVAPVSPVRSARTVPRRHSTRPSKGGVLAIIGLVVFVGGVLAISGSPHEQSGAALTDGPSPTSAPALAGIPSLNPSPVPAPSATLVAATAPAVEATARPTPKPTPKPTPRPTPKPTPKPYCRVPNLVGVATNRATGIWSNAGFTSSINFSPDVPPHYTITSQSRSAGTSVTCSSGITVHGTP